MKFTCAPLLVLVVACAPKVPADPPQVEDVEPAEPSPDADAAPLKRPPAGGVDPGRRENTGLASCDEYLALYQACEPKLKGEIQAGERRTYAAERAWIEYMRDTPEGAELGQACWDMRRALEDACAARD